ncbi:MAG: phosphoribosylaminoimidazolesuccinocarboxamide synthase [Fimbriimonadaceae bacterium]
MPALLSPAISRKPIAHGKVREIYDLGSELLIVTTDRISAFDVVMQNGIPDKGRVLNQMSAFWFSRFASVCPNHVVSIADADVQARLGEWDPALSGRCLIARKAAPLKIECVARGYITGSLFKEYRAEGGSVHALGLPSGLVDSDRLEEPIFTPATKAESGHDMNLSWLEAVDIVGFEVATRVRDLTLSIYSSARSYAETKGLILADTKFEFGLTEDGVVWIDEALTPDSSRYWPADLYQPGRSQPSFDKQFVRDYLENINFNKQPPGPALPEEIVQKTRGKYLEAYERIVGEPLVV